MHEILDSSTAGYLKRNDQHYSYRRGPEKATICYLVLPSRTAKWETRLDPSCRGSDYYYGESATSMIVDRSSLDLTEKHQRRFARAMLRLALNHQYTHPSYSKNFLQLLLSTALYCRSRSSVPVRTRRCLRRRRK
jgi:hypothetical protein